MPPHYGIDTSILVRLLTGRPEGDFARCVEQLRRLIEEEDAELLASNQVIGEAYMAVQHHYGVSKADARAGLASVLRSGFVAPLQGEPVFAALAADGGCGLLDRLIALEHHARGLRTLTLDERMARLPGARLLGSARQGG